MVTFRFTRNGLRAVRTLDPVSLPQGEHAPTDDPCDARSWVQRVSDWIAPLETGDLSALDMADGRRDLAGAVDALDAPHVHYWSARRADMWCETEQTTTDQCSAAISRPSGNV